VTITTNRPTAPSSTATVAPPPIAAVDIVGCGVVSGAGIGLGPIASALTGSPKSSQWGGQVPEGYPPLPLRAASHFDPAAILGCKGLSRMTRTDQLAIAACTLALGNHAEMSPSRSGVVLGTSVGSTSAISDFFRDTFDQDRPYLVNPSAFPGTLMNSAAGKAAIRHHLTGMNATVSGGPLASLNAFRYARTMLLTGRASRLLAGGVEELSPQAAWAWYGSQALLPGTMLGEGSAVFALEARRPTGTEDSSAANAEPSLARILACEVGYADTTRGALAVSARLAECIGAALTGSGVSTENVTVIAPGASARRGWSAVEQRALSRQLPAMADRRVVHIGAVLGETFGASAALQLAAVLALWQAPSTARSDQRVAVITSVGIDGCVGCMVLTHPDFH